MQQDSGIQLQDLDQVLRTAQVRRSTDLGLRLQQYVQDHRLARERREADGQHAISTQPGRNLPAHRSRSGLETERRRSLSSTAKGASIMAGWWTRRVRTLVIANSLAAAAVLLVVVAGPRPVSSAALGSEWRCRKTALVVTTCRPTVEYAQAVDTD